MNRLYSRTSERKFVNEARKKLFATGQQIENIPPTQDALTQHTKEHYIQEYTCIFGIEHLCHNMIYPVLLLGDGRKKKMNRGF